jgi:hypothetical protein
MLLMVASDKQAIGRESSREQISRLLGFRRGEDCGGIAIVPYLSDSRVICGDILEPVFCLIGCFLLIAVGVWSIMAIVRRMNRTQGAPAILLSVTLVSAAFVGVVVSGAWISCSLSGYVSLPAALAPATAVGPRFPLS